MTSAPDYRIYETYCQWFLAIYHRPFAASREEFEAALRQPVTWNPHEVIHQIAEAGLEDPTYLDGIEEREGLYR